MKRAVHIFALSLAALLGACGSHQSANGNAETAGPHLADLCVKKSEWPTLIAELKAFGVAHDLELHGGIDNATPDGRPQLNVYLAKGYSYYFGDDLDLWFASDPFRSDVVNLNAPVKKKPLTRDEQALADELMTSVVNRYPQANGPSDNLSCH
jgi:hypothetical protein